jgi:carbon monoxide dehydrogenase subunit G
MRIEGSFVVGAPREAVWPRIKDPALIAGCIPGCRKIEALSPTSYRAEMTIAVGPVKADFNLVVDISREEPPERILSSTRGEEGSRASILSAENVVSLVDLGDGSTRVSYSSEVSVTGRLGKFGLGMMKKKAEAIGNEFAGAFRAKVEAAMHE